MLFSSRAGSLSPLSESLDVTDYIAADVSLSTSSMLPSWDGLQLPSVSETCATMNSGAGGCSGTGASGSEAGVELISACELMLESRF